MALRGDGAASMLSPPVSSLPPSPCLAPAGQRAVLWLLGVLWPPVRCGRGQGADLKVLRGGSELVSPRTCLGAWLQLTHADISVSVGLQACPACCLGCLPYGQPYFPVRTCHACATFACCGPPCVDPRGAALTAPRCTPMGRQRRSWAQHCASWDTRAATTSCPPRSSSVPVRAPPPHVPPACVVHCQGSAARAGLLMGQQQAMFEVPMADWLRIAAASPCSVGSRHLVFTPALEGKSAAPYPTLHLLSALLPPPAGGKAPTAKGLSRKHIIEGTKGGARPGCRGAGVE